MPAMDLVNYDGFMWVGPLIMGGEVKLEVVYDTGSDWTAVESSTCFNCDGDAYDVSLSGGSPVKKYEEMIERVYGSANIRGYVYLDKVCLDFNTCVESFECILIEE